MNICHKVIPFPEHEVISDTHRRKARQLQLEIAAYRVGFVDINMASSCCANKKSVAAYSKWAVTTLFSCSHRTV